MKDHNKNINQKLLKDKFKLVFNDNQDCKNLLTDMNNNTKFISWSNYLREATDSLKAEGYDFNFFAEMDIITLAHKRDMTYDFCLKHKISAFEWKLNAMINKDKNVIIKIPRIWRHPTKVNFECYRV